MKNNTIKIVIFALSKWDGEYSSTTFSLANEFSQTGTVLYINNPTTLKDYFLRLFQESKSSRLQKNRIEYLSENLIVFYPPLVFPINYLPKGYIYKKLKKINEYIIFSSVKKHLRRLGFAEYIYLNIFNPFFDHHGHINPTLNIYYTVDNISESAYVKKHGVWLEPELMRKSDLSLATSMMLKTSNEKYNENIYYLPNAADLTIFNLNLLFDKPKEIAHINTEIITFVGHLDMRTDIEILKIILNRHKHRTLLIIGPTSLDKKVLNDLRSYENILFIGSQPLQTVPAFLKHSSCAIIPFKCNKLTKGIYPLKINEYLAMGLPVVSTCFSEDILGFKDTISLAKDSLEFSDLIDWEIKNNSPLSREKRVLVANENTWPKRVSQFWDIVKKYGLT